jgi:NAD(P) transhydrogenase subunit beta
VNLSILMELAYLISAVLFVFGLKRMGSPATAVRGNQLASLAMLIAIVTTLSDQALQGRITWGVIAGGLVLGSVIGAFAARTVKMTSMPEMVGIFNGLGGGASAIVALAEYFRAGGFESSGAAVSIMIGILIGTVTLSGSYIAFAKLSGQMTGNPILFPGQKILNAGLFLAALVLGGMMVANGPTLQLVLIFTGIAFFLGILLVIPIGGADMPVVISLLNSYSGLAAAAAGFVIGNNLLIIAGSLVGAAGLILTNLMCKAMNRSLANVMFAGFGTEGAGAVEIGDRTVRSADAEQVALMLAYAQSVVFVPGYGLAVAQAQHDLKKVAGLLEERGVDVKYAIHPVAGRMPGHMNVLLAEADVPYPQLYDLDEINDDFPTVDVAVVVGANDVVNPLARDPKSVIAGMPILDVDKARTCIVMKRSLSPGFAGIDNPLFYNENTTMFFGNAKESMVDLAKEVREA